MTNSCSTFFWRTMLLPALIVLLFIVSCREEKKPDRFLDAYVNLRLATASFGKNSPEGRLARRKILATAKMSLEEFAEQAELLRQEPHRWSVFQDSVVRRLRSLHEEHKKMIFAEKKKAKEEKKSKKEVKP